MKEVNQEETAKDCRDNEMNPEVDSKDMVMRDGRNDPWFWEERIGGRARVTTDEEQARELERDKVTQVGTLVCVKKFFGKREIIISLYSIRSFN